MAAMSRSSREVEVKLPFDSAGRARSDLAAIGAKPVVERYFEDNVVYDRDVDPLRASGCLLRLRRVGHQAVLTFKAPVPGEHRHKVRREEETEVADPDVLDRILAGLGFRPFYRYQKFRTEYRLGKLGLLLDETPIGCFVELEGPPDEIDRAAERLGVPPERWVLETYREIHERLARESGREAGDLVFDPAELREAR